MQMFSFYCAVGKDSTWFVEHSPLSMTLFKLHFIVIFMYCTIFIIVLYKIPFKYDRIMMTDSEKKKERKSRNKKRAKRKGRNKKKDKEISGDLRAHVLKY